MATGTRPQQPEPAPADCSVVDCDAEAVTVLTYSTYPHKNFPLCEAHRTTSLAWIRDRWGSEVTVTEAPVQPALLTRREVDAPC